MLDLDAVPRDEVIPSQGATRTGSAGGQGGAGMAAGGMAGAGMGDGIGASRSPHEEADPPTPNTDHS